MGNPFASFLLGAVNNASVTITTPTLATYRSLGLFVQDDFHVNSRLTLNLGLRWDYNPTQTEEHNRLFSFSPTATDPQTGLPGALTFAGNCTGCNGSTGFVKQHYHNFGPRVGFALPGELQDRHTRGLWRILRRSCAERLLRRSQLQHGV